MNNEHQKRPLDQPVRPETASERWLSLYHAINEMMAPLGAYGEIYATDDRVSAVMDALNKLDGGTYLPPREIAQLQAENKRLRGMVADLMPNVELTGDQQTAKPAVGRPR